MRKNQFLARTLVVLALATLVFASGCGGKGGSSPTAPSAVVPGTTIQFSTLSWVATRVSDGSEFGAPVTGPVGMNGTLKAVAVVSVHQAGISYVASFRVLRGGVEVWRSAAAQGSYSTTGDSGFSRSFYPYELGVGDYTLKFDLIESAPGNSEQVISGSSDFQVR